MTAYEDLNEVGWIRAAIHLCLNLQFYIQNGGNGAVWVDCRCAPNPPYCHCEVILPLTSPDAFTGII